MMPVKDADLRATILCMVYKERHNSRDGWANVQPDPATPEEEQRITYNICGQLQEHGLIQWKGNSRGEYYGLGKITPRGIDVIEGNTEPPIAISIDKRSYSISGSMGVQIGERNVQDIRLDADTIFAAVDRSSASISQKEEAKSLWAKVLASPVLAPIIGAIAGSE